MIIYGLVGPSGTGKSHRASLVAHRLQAEAIIDDGLLIHQGRIVAGHSAKREDTRMGATRRAIFSDPAHAAEVRQALDRLGVASVLVLGTSAPMIDRILQALGLAGTRWIPIPIEKVASAEEIATARNLRQAFGRHVIPAPTLEVKKSFAGYLVHPLRLIWRSQDQRRVVVEKSVVRPTFSGLGRFYIAEGVLGALAAEPVRRHPGVARIARCAVFKAGEGVRVELEVELLWGRPLRTMLEELQRLARAAVEAATSLNVAAVDVTCRRLVLPPALRRVRQLEGE